MSKVKKEIVEAAAVKLLTNITSTMPTPAHKFLLGSVSALAALDGGRKIDQLLGMAADRDGFIRVEQIKAAVSGGFDAAGGKIQVDLFRDQTGLMGMLVKPLTLTITKDDIMQLVSEIEEHATKEVRLGDENTEQAEGGAGRAAAAGAV